MCIAVPCEVVEPTAADDLVGTVEALGTRRVVNVALIGRPLRAGEWVLVHAGSAIGEIDADEARELLALLVELADAPAAG